MTKKQVLVIHGGETFETYDEYMQYLRDYPLERILKKTETRRWKDRLQDDLGGSYDVFSPMMPNMRNAKYEEWKIWIEKYVPILRNDIILIGHSLGAIFLAKYLSENDFPVRVVQSHLVAGPYQCRGWDALSESLEKIEQQVKKIYIYHSTDDPVVDFADAQKFHKALPSAELITFDHRGHFLDEYFPELLTHVKED